MALRNAYKQRVQSDSDDREQLGSIHSVEALMRGGNHSRAPREISTRGVSKTSEVIENAFGFLKSNTYDAYSRYGSDGESDITDVVGYRDNFTFGPPRSSRYGPPGGHGPTSPSYDGEAPRDRRYAVDSGDQLSYNDDISLKPSGNGYIGNGLVPDRFRYKRLPRIGENGTAIPNDDGYLGRNSRWPQDLRRQISYDSYRHPYPARMPYYSYPEYSEDEWYPEDDGRGYTSRYPESQDGYSNPDDNGVQKTKTNAEEQTTKSTSRRRYLFIVLLIIALIIAAGIAAVITLHFLGYFESKPAWKDGYDVEAIFSNEYNDAWDEKNSEEYKKEAVAFKALTEKVLDKKYQGHYGVQVKNISRGSTKYTFVVELAIETNTTNLERFLTSGYREVYMENGTELILTGVSAKVNEKYTTTAAPVTTGSTVTTQASETTKKSSTGAGVTTEPPESTKEATTTSKVTTQASETTEESSTGAGVTTEPPKSTKEATTTSKVTTQASETTEESSTTAGVTTEGKTTSSIVTTQASETTENMKTTAAATTQNKAGGSGTTTSSSVTTQASETTEEGKKTTAATTQNQDDESESSTGAGVTTEPPKSTREATTTSKVTTQASETTEDKKTTAAATT